MAEDARAGAGSEVITEEQLRKAEEYVQQEEGAANRLSGWVGIVVTGIAVAMTLFHLYAAYDIVPTIPLRYTHVAFVLLLSFLLFPLSERFRNRIQWFDVIPPLLGIATIVYALAQGRTVMTAGTGEPDLAHRLERAYFGEGVPTPLHA